MREAVIPSFITIMVKSIAKLMTHSKYMNMVIGPIVGYSDHIVIARSYDVLRPGEGKVNICLRNDNAKQNTLPKWAAVGEIAVANAILALLPPKSTEKEAVRGEATAQQRQSGG